MANGSSDIPLLHNYADSANPTTRARTSDEGLIADATNRHASGIVHLLLAYFTLSAFFFDAQHTFITALTDATPPWRCLAPANSSCAAAAAATASPCGLPDGSWKWDLPPESRIATDWGLACADPSLASMPTLAFFTGCLIGGFLFFMLADVHGRKNTLLGAMLTMSIAGIATAASPNIWVYSLCRFVSGLGRSLVVPCSFVLAEESVGRRFRDAVNVFPFLCFGMGFLSLPAAGYLLRRRSWRLLYLAASIPFLLYTVLHFFLIRESPRWLLLNKRFDEVDGIVDIDRAAIAKIQVGECLGLLSTMKKMAAKGWALRWLMAIEAASFGIGLVYYGMPMSIGTIMSDDLYVGLAFNAVAELPSAFLGCFLLVKLPRREVLLVLMALAGVSCLLCVVLPGGDTKLAGEVSAFFNGCTALTVTHIFCTELFPTEVRNSALVLARQAMVLGGAVAPALLAAGRGNVLVNMGIFGMAILAGGVTVYSFVPETKGRSLADTMEEVEHWSDVNVAVESPPS